MTNSCCVPDCKSKYLKNTKVKFHRFPRNEKFLKLWMNKVKIKKIPTEWNYVCSLHFKSSDYEPYSTGRISRLKRDTVPSIGLPLRKSDEDNNEIGENCKSSKRSPVQDSSQKRMQIKKVKPIETLEEVTKNPTEDIEIGDLEEISDKIPFKTIIPISRPSQTNIKMSHIQTVFYETLNNNNIKYLTGFNINSFNLFLHSLNDDFLPNKFNILLKKEDQLILCLFKLKHNLDFILIGFIYQISTVIASTIFENTIKIIYKYFKNIDFWSKKFVSKNCYTAIIDCAEIETEKSLENPEVNSDMLSHEKKYTMKYLIAIDAEGFVIYCSEVVGGSTNNRATVIESKFLNKLREYDKILAYRDFDISDLLEKNNIELGICSTIGETDNYSEGSHVIIDSRISHIKRIIGIKKNFAILNGTYPATLWYLADVIIYSANMLCNFIDNDVN